MKVLNIMARLFIPLTFIAGIYGLNFEYMPELTVRWGYFAIWGVMLTTTPGMLLYFRRKGWIGGARTPVPSDEDSDMESASEQPRRRIQRDLTKPKRSPARKCAAPNQATAQTRQLCEQINRLNPGSAPSRRRSPSPT